jgi:predicted metal-dependent TIM-barrel fold hydrolase
MSEFNPESVRERIREAIHHEVDFSDAVVDDIAFHMTDWLADLEAYARFCAEPRSMSDEEIRQMLMAFLVHVPNHVAAASKLLTGVPVTDIFKVGAISEDTREEG